MHGPVNTSWLRVNITDLIQDLLKFLLAATQPLLWFDSIQYNNILGTMPLVDDKVSFNTT